MQKDIEQYADEIKTGLNDDAVTKYTARPASEFGEDTTRFLWYPLIPIGDYTVLMSPGGSGKTYVMCFIAAKVSRGEALPDDIKPKCARNVLIISAEDSGELLKKRLKACGADLDKVFIIDRSSSLGLNFTNGYDTFLATIKVYNPALVVIDPWHGFIGENVDVNKINAVRPVFQKLANTAKECDCGMVLISHVNKKSQGENVNNAASGSTDFINAARSACYLIFDETDEDARILVHTKSNYAKYGRSIRFLFSDGGITWSGYSDIDRQTMEEAARSRKTPGEIVKTKAYRDGTKDMLIRALDQAAQPFEDSKFTYDEFKDMYGGDIFGNYQPKRILDDVAQDMRKQGYEIVTGKQVRDSNGIKKNGFVIRPIPEPLDQVEI